MKATTAFFRLRTLYVLVALSVSQPIFAEPQYSPLGVDAFLFNAHKIRVIFYASEETNRCGVREAELDTIVTSELVRSSFDVTNEDGLADLFHIQLDTVDAGKVCVAHITVTFETYASSSVPYADGRYYTPTSVMHQVVRASATGRAEDLHRLVSERMRFAVDKFLLSVSEARRSVEAQAPEVYAVYRELRKQRESD